MMQKKKRKKKVDLIDPFMRINLFTRHKDRYKHECRGYQVFQHVTYFIQ